MRILVFVLLLSMIVLSCKEATTPDIKIEETPTQRFRYSLAQWSLNKELFAGDIQVVDFIDSAAVWGFEGVEYVNGFFKDKATDTLFLKSLNDRAKSLGMTQVLIMIDGEGDLGVQDETRRKEAVTNHFKWIDAAHYLGCGAIRVNAFGEGSPEMVAAAMAKSIKELCNYAESKHIKILIENHGWYSSDGKWLASVIQQVGHPLAGTLPDFGNFCIEKQDPQIWSSPCINNYDPYQGVSELIPYAGGLSAKSYHFGADGKETTLDYEKFAKIIQESTFSGFIGIEYEGDSIPAPRGIALTKKLIESYLE